MQIEGCHRAELVLKDAPAFEFQNVLGYLEDELPSCSNPVISGDGNILIFLVDYPNDKKIMMSRRSEGVWLRPRVINSEIGMVGETYPVSLSYDGLELYLVHQFYSHSDIFVSRFEGSSWSAAEALGPNVNGRTSEEHASISRDGKSLYFTSDTRGGEGSLDIYVSTWDEKGEWGMADNLGPVVNTPYEEHSPFISSNDSILFFSSQGHSSIGGIDVFYAELGSDGEWMEPRNLGYPVNTTADNLFFNPGWDELDGYYAVRRADDPSSNSINMVIELDPPEEFAATGKEEAVAPVEVPETALVVAPVAVQANTVEEALEPEETDEILEVLNRGLEEADQDISGSPTSLPASRAAPRAGARGLQTCVHFEHNDFELTFPGMLELEKVAELMQAYPASTIHLSGHADATGLPDYNMLLSGQRAAKIAEYLEMRGISDSRVTIEGKGENAPIARNHFPDGSDAPLGRYLNRQAILTLENSEPIQTELSGFYVPVPLKAPTGEEEAGDQSYWFTVQLAADLKPIDDQFFKEISPLKTHHCKDGYYRYSSGKFRSFEEARTYLDPMKKSGYPDAFIQTLDWYSKAVD